jgi:hypothetical protein
MKSQNEIIQAEALKLPMKLPMKLARQSIEIAYEIVQARH